MSRDGNRDTSCCCNLLCRIVCPCIYRRCCVNRTYKDNGNADTTQQTDRAGKVPPPPPAKTGTRLIVRALYDFQARQNDEISFMKGDRMEVVEKSENVDWWTVKHIFTKNIGYVPSNYICIDDNRPESQDWWFSIDRREADKQLLLPGNSRGTFLIRNSGDQRTYALSIRNFDEYTRAVTIKHYRIHKLPNGDVCISQTQVFSDLLELVNHYRQHADGLCCLLSKACPKDPEPVPFKEFEVDRKEIELSTKLGQGQFGEVWAGKLFRTVDVAVKTLKPGTMTSNDFLNEARAMHQLRHRKLVLLMGVCTNVEPYYIITELMTHGSLLDYLKTDSIQSTITFDTLIDMAAQIADGLAYLELQKYIHRDVRAANILVGDNNVVKVADFGLARLVPQRNENADGLADEIYTANDHAKFPIKWTAPEAFDHRQFSTKSDIWSFGILLYEMITLGRMPYPAMNNTETMDFVRAGERMQKPVGCRIECPQKLYDIMLHCWHRIPEKRPTFEHLYTVFDNFNVATEQQYEPA